MSFGALILAAGEGKRMGAERAKVLLDICGRPMLRYAVDAVRTAGAEAITIVVGPGSEAVREAVDGADVSWATQETRNGTGGAVRSARERIENGPKNLLITCGDMPLLTADSITRLVETFEQEDVSAAILTAQMDDPCGYGRIVRDDNGALSRIVEEADAIPEETMIAEVNTGLYLFDRDALLATLDRLDDSNVQGEYYLTDVPALLLADGKRVALTIAEDESEAWGVNTPGDLLEVAAVMRWRILERLIVSGVSIPYPESVYVDHDVTVGARTKILPFTVIRAGVTVGSDCEVGPFTHLRPGARLEDRAEVGNFVEVKASTVGAGTKAKHLSYLGDVTIGAGANIGAGTIVANYDGKKKHKTEIADEAFIGSGTILVAPVKVGKGAVTGAGAVVTKEQDVPDGGVVVGVPAKPLAKDKKRE